MPLRLKSLMGPLRVRCHKGTIFRVIKYVLKNGYPCGLMVRIQVQGTIYTTYSIWKTFVSTMHNHASTPNVFTISSVTLEHQEYTLEDVHSSR